MRRDQGDNLVDSVTDLLLGDRIPVAEELQPLVPEGVTLRRGRLVPRIGGLLARMGGPAAAVALGRTIVVHPDVRLTERLLRHELEHVRQWRGDLLFPLRYALETVRNGYRENRYEQEARRAERAGHEPPS